MTLQEVFPPSKRVRILPQERQEEMPICGPAGEGAEFIKKGGRLVGSTSRQAVGRNQSSSGRLAIHFQGIRGSQGMQSNRKGWRMDIIKGSRGRDCISSIGYHRFYTPMMPPSFSSFLSRCSDGIEVN